jgi:RNA polymerase sigma-70 factor (ECF subfamily)
MGGAVALEGIAVEPDLERRFRSLVETHRDRALGLAWRLVGGDAAEDVTQDAFVKAFQGLAGFRGDAALETWFYRILVRQAHSYRRWRRVRTLWTGGVLDDPADPRPAAPGDPALRRRIAAALDRLTRSQREAFVLVYLEGFRIRECAEVLGKPVGTVKSHLHRALTHLRRDLADLETPSPVADPEDAE